MKRLNVLPAMFVSSLLTTNIVLADQSSQDSTYNIETGSIITCYEASKNMVGMLFDSVDQVLEKLDGMCKKQPSVHLSSFPIVDNETSTFSNGERIPYKLSIVNGVPKRGYVFSGIMGSIKPHISNNDISVDLSYSHSKTTNVESHALNGVIIELPQQVAHQGKISIDIPKNKVMIVTGAKNDEHEGQLLLISAQKNI